ncbi:hypothetical protein KW785_03050 [Candidatus Parcubacteria bacterium]|nr:hypothetical protein [Candidatus Parcubacteria bacterium]
MKRILSVVLAFAVLGISACTEVNNYLTAPEAKQDTVAQITLTPPMFISLGTNLGSEIFNIVRFYGPPNAGYKPSMFGVTVENNLLVLVNSSITETPDSPTRSTYSYEIHAVTTGIGVGRVTIFLLNNPKESVTFIIQVNQGNEKG